MSDAKINDGGPAFPLAEEWVNGREQNNGMTLRDWFAGMALQGYNANREQCANMTHEQAAANAYRDADAMLAAKKEKA